MQPPPAYAPPTEDRHLHDRDLEAQIHVLSPITSEFTPPRPPSPSSSPPPTYPQTTDDTTPPISTPSQTSSSPPPPPTYPSSEYISPFPDTEKHRALFPYALPDGYREIQPHPDVLAHQRAVEEEMEYSPFQEKILYTVIFLVLLSAPGIWVGMCVDWGVGLKLVGGMVGGSAVLVPAVAGLVWCIHGNEWEREGCEIEGDNSRRGSIYLT